MKFLGSHIKERQNKADEINYIIFYLTQYIWLWSFQDVINIEKF